MRLGEGGDLRQMGDAQHLMVHGQLGQHATHPIGDPPAHAGVHLVEDQHHAGGGFTQRLLERQEDARKIASNAAANLCGIAIIKFCNHRRYHWSCSLVCCSLLAGR